MTLSITGGTNITMTDGTTIPAAQFANTFNNIISNSGSDTVLRTTTKFIGTTGVDVNQAIYQGRTIVLTSNTVNYNVQAGLISAGWDQSSAITATIVVAANTFVYANTPYVPAIETGYVYPAGSNITIINYGIISGGGGFGAYGTYDAGSVGGTGGSAIGSNVNVSIFNAGLITGGAGGGASSNGARDGYGNPSSLGGSGGGGVPLGLGGIGAGNATTTTAGSGGTSNGTGGSGGAFASPGNSSSSGQAGGAVGNYFSVRGTTFKTIGSGRQIGTTNFVTDTGFNPGLVRSYWSAYFADNVNYFSANARYYYDINTGNVALGRDGEPFSQQWIGQFLAPTTATYTFYTTSDDASYLWVGTNAVSGFTTGNAVVNNGGSHGAQEASGTIALTAGVYYFIRIQQGNGGGPTEMSTGFSAPGISKRGFSGYTSWRHSNVWVR